MRKSDLFSMSLNSLWRRKTRTILTVLGVVIGTASIIIMLSLGIAMDKGFKDQLQHMGSLNIIEVRSDFYGPSMPGDNNQKKQLDSAAVNSFSQIKGVKAVMPQKSTYMRVVSGKMVGDISIIGINPLQLEAFDFKVQEGRLLLPSDKEAILFGSQIPYQFYNSRLRDPWAYRGDAPPQVDLLSDRLILTADMEYGQRNRSNQDSNYRPPKAYKAKGVGILEMSNGESDYNAYMNLAVLEKIIAENERSNRESRPQPGFGQQNQYDVIKVKVTDINQVVPVQDQIKAMGYQTFSLTDMLESMKKTSRTLQAILGGIGAISLLVAAIGITNTMVMSIYERTREIGVIKVLGAEMTDIRRLFLIEAALIGFGGGVIGLLFSYLISWILNTVGARFMADMGSPSAISIIPPLLGISAVAFATLVGIVAGYSPARRAMNLSALDAIRSE
ncbi:MAG: ABC transporter permease [Syntrophomonadaceae bacterium]|nr:ABC transporter permease [Syntrophomonadaceae bacterium]